MPVHDWTRVDAGIFHHFHLGWIDAISRALNRGLLPPDYYALAEQIAGGVSPDVLTLQGPANGAGPPRGSGGSVALADAPPRVWFRTKTEADVYAAKGRVVTIRHVSNHRVIAVVEIVSPGNKDRRQAVRAFVAKADDLLRAGVHLLVIDLFPPSPRDPQGINKAIWDEFQDNETALPEERKLSVAAYIGCPGPEIFLEPTAAGAKLPDMPLFLTQAEYVPVPLEETYQSAWEAVPAYWQAVLAC